MWKWRELLPLRGAPISLGEAETPIIALMKYWRSEPLVKDEGRLADGFVQGARAGDGGDHGEGAWDHPVAMPTNGNAGAALAAYGARAGIESS